MNKEIVKAIKEGLKDGKKINNQEAKGCFCLIEFEDNIQCVGVGESKVDIVNMIANYLNSFKSSLTAIDKKQGEKIFREMMSELLKACGIEE